MDSLFANTCFTVVRAEEALINANYLPLMWGRSILFSALRST